MRETSCRIELSITSVEDAAVYYLDAYEFHVIAIIEIENLPSAETSDQELRTTLGEAF